MRRFSDRRIFYGSRAIEARVGFRLAGSAAPPAGYVSRPMKRRAVARLRFHAPRRRGLCAPRREATFFWIAG